MKERHIRYDKSFVWNLLFVYPDCKTWRTVNDSDELDYLNSIVTMRSAIVVAIIPILFVVIAGMVLS